MVRGWHGAAEPKGVLSMSSQLQRSQGWAMWSSLKPLWPSHGSPSAKSGSVTLLQPLCPFVQCWDERLLALDAQHWDKIGYICSSLNGVVQYPLHTVTQVRLQLQILYAFFASPSRAWSDSPSGHVAALFENLGHRETADVPSQFNAVCFYMDCRTVCSFMVSVWRHRVAQYLSYLPWKPFP